MTETNRIGNGHGINVVTLIDCRIAGPATYIPEHPRQNAQPGDKNIQAQADFTVFQNIRDKKMTFEITAWGKMADVVARGGATGKQVHLVCSLHSFRGKVWFPVPDGAPRQFVTRADGQPLLIEKTGLTLEDISFGTDSAKTIQEEIDRGLRPIGWNNPANPGYQDWRNRCAQNNALQYQPGMEWFGYAKVRTYGQTPQQFNQAPQNQQPQYNQQNYGFQGATNMQNPQQGQAQPYYPQNPGNNPQYVNGQYVGQGFQQNPVAQQPQVPQYQQYQAPQYQQNQAPQYQQNQVPQQNNVIM